MDRLLLGLFVVLSIAWTNVYAEVGQTNTVDAMALKPDHDVVSLIIYFVRPWSSESLELLAKKLVTYRYAINSGDLSTRYPGTAGKRMRIIVLHQEAPDAASERKLLEARASFVKNQVEFSWGNVNQAGALAIVPARKRLAAPLEPTTPELAALDRWHRSLLTGDFAAYAEATVEERWSPQPSMEGFQSLRRNLPESLWMLPQSAEEREILVFGCVASIKYGAMVRISEGQRGWGVKPLTGWNQTFGPESPCGS